jgi:hypothetical protein
VSEEYEFKEPDPESDPDDDELDEDYTVSEGFDGTDGDHSEDEPSAAMLTILSVLSSFEDHLKGPLGGKRKQKTIHGWIASFRRFLVKHQMKIQGKSISFIATMPVTKYVEGLGKISAKVQFSEALKEFTTMASIQDGTESTLQTLKASRLKAKLMLKTSRRMKHQETKMKAKSVEELESNGQWLDFRKLKEMTCNNPDVAQDWLEYVEQSKINWDHMSTRIKSRGLDILMGSIFLRSKAIRPESLMVLPKSAWTNSHVSGLNNVLHSQTFKTEGVYGYTTLVLDKIMSSMINQYLLVVRPLITESTGSTSSNLFLNSVGKPFKQLTYELVRFTERYAGVSITPTRLRMIYETFIDEHGSQEQKAAAALSLAHSPTIVKKHYLKRRADEAALKDFQTYSLTNNMITTTVTVAEPGPQTPVKGMTLNDAYLKDSSTLLSSTPKASNITTGGPGSPGPGPGPGPVLVTTPIVTTVQTPVAPAQPQSVLTDSAPGSGPPASAQPDPFTASAAPGPAPGPFLKEKTCPNVTVILRERSIKALTQCHPVSDLESRSHSKEKILKILKPPVSLKRQNGVTSLAPDAHDDRVVSSDSESQTVTAAQSISSASHRDSNSPGPATPANPGPGHSPIASSQTVVVPLTPVVSVHKTKRIKTSEDSVCGGRWGDSAWKWTDQSISYILEKVRQGGNSFKQIHIDGIRDNVWTESCTPNKIKNRFHSHCRKKIKNSEGLQLQ